MIQVWTINILVMQSRGHKEKIQNGQKHHRTKASNNKNESGQNQQKRKYCNTKTIKVYDPISNNQGVQSHFCSCHHLIQVWIINILVMPSRGWTEKSQNGQKHHRTKAPKDKNQRGQNPQKGKYFWYSNNQGVRSNFCSCDHMMQVWTIKWGWLAVQ